LAPFNAAITEVTPAPTPISKKSSSVRTFIASEKNSVSSNLSIGKTFGY
jgi:hypothetical protein